MVNVHLVRLKSYYEHSTIHLDHFKIIQQYYQNHLPSGTELHCVLDALSFAHVKAVQTKSYCTTLMI